MSTNQHAASATPDVRIAGTGLFTPPNKITNEELVEAYNGFVAKWNADNAPAIEAGDVEPLQP